jgi:hypothetical protein
MKIILLLIVLIALMMSSTDCNWIIQVTIVMPTQILPYYEWLINFPGLLPGDDKPSLEELQINIGFRPPGTSLESGVRAFRWLEISKFQPPDLFKWFSRYLKAWVNPPSNWNIMES